MEESQGVRRGPQKRPRFEVTTNVPVPTLELGNMEDQSNNHLRSIAHLYQTNQAVYLPGYLKYIHCVSKRKGQAGERNDSHSPLDTGSSATTLGWSEVHDVFTSLTEKDKDSFCIENSSSSGQASSPEFLDSSTSGAGYCSFLVQEQRSLSQLLERLPVPFLSDESSCNNDTRNKRRDLTLSACTCCRCWEYEPCLWIFFGRNPTVTDGEHDERGDLQGRPEHTDSISHDGTWHYQLSGTKRWLLRPTSRLWNMVHGENAKEELPQASLAIDCHEGDVLIVNTRLWYHQTILPPQPHPSISYARDFWIRNSRAAAASRQDDKDRMGTMMTNVDGLYATDDISEGHIIFREQDIPDCELHRSATNPNCEVVELDDGTQAVVSIRRIVAGEFFCVGESSDEDDADGEEECEESWGEVDDN